MRGRSNGSDLAAPGPVPADAPIAATPAQISGMRGRGPGQPIPWPLLSLVGRGGGLLLFFLGTLVAVIGGSFPADCFTSTCSGSTSAGIQYAILVTRLFWSLGAFGLAAGAAIELHFVLRGPEEAGPEANARFLAARRSAFVLVLVGIGVLLALVLSQGGAIAPPL